jgi:hypothetical protein
MSPKSEFTGLHAKLDADTLLDFAISRRRNKTGIGKSTLVKTVPAYSAV